MENKSGSNTEVFSIEWPFKAVSISDQLLSAFSRQRQTFDVRLNFCPSIWAETDDFDQYDV